MATVNGKEIFAPTWTSIMRKPWRQPAATLPEQAEIVKLNILKQMIDDEILQQRQRSSPSRQR